MSYIFRYSFFFFFICFSIFAQCRNSESTVCSTNQCSSCTEYESNKSSGEVTILSKFSTPHKLDIKSDKFRCIPCSCGSPDKKIDEGEECDDGNNLSNDGCSAHCLIEYCGDEIQQLNEECDLGPYNGIEGHGCSEDCKNNICLQSAEFVAKLCGNNIKECAEECDLGERNGADKSECSSTCEVLPVCGNSKIEEGETCDDGDLNGSAASDCAVNCTEAAVVSVCGNNVKDPGEDCDLGPIAKLGCTNTCKSLGADSCGRAVGNANYGKGCLDSCGRKTTNPNFGKTNCCTGVNKPSTGTQCIGSDCDYIKYCLAGQKPSASFAAYNDDNNVAYVGKLSYAKSANQQNTCWTCATVRINGCFAPESKLLLADGTEKPISEISAGEKLKNPIGDPHTVKKIIESYENSEMLEIVVANYRLVVTQGHPIKTKNGIVQASKLRLDQDLILTVDGKYSTIQSIKKLPLQEKQRVLNITIEEESLSSEHLVIADGIVTGDLTDQQALAKK